MRTSAVSGEFADAPKLRERVLAGAQQLDDITLLAQVLSGGAGVTPWTGRTGVTAETLSRATEQVLCEMIDPALRIRLLTSLALQLSGEPGNRGAAAAAEAVERAGGLDTPELLALALTGMYANLHHSADQLADRQRVAEQLRALACRHELTGYRVLAHLLLRQTAAGRLDLAAAAGHFAEGQRLAEESDLPMLAAIGEWSQCMRLAITGRFAAADQAYTEAAERLRATGAAGGAETGWIGTLLVQYALGQAADLAEDTLLRYESSGRRGLSADLCALALAEKGCRRLAATIATTAGPVRDDCYRDLHLSVRGLVAVALGDQTAAAVIYPMLRPYAGRFAGSTTASVALCPVALVLGDLAQLLGRGTAQQHYRQAAEVARTIGSVHWERVAENRMPIGRTPRAAIPVHRSA